MSEMPWALFEVQEDFSLKPKRALDLELVQARFKLGATVIGKYKRSRSKPQHDLYWEILRRVVKGTGRWHAPEDLHEAIKLDLRMVTGLSMMNGEVRFIARSTSFTAMDDDEFQEFFQSAMQSIAEATGIDTDDLIAEIKGDERRAA